MEFPGKDKSEPYNYVIKCTSGSCEWLLQLVTQWPGQLEYQSSFIWVSVSWIIWINGSLIHLSKQTAPHKSQANRMEALPFTLGFSYRLSYFTISNLVRF